MAEIVRMPKMSDTMTEGVVSKWHKKIGDTVKSGDLVADIETDKATMEFESYQEGVLLYIGVDEGKSVPVDGILAVLGKAGEDYKLLLDEEQKKGGSQQSAVGKEEKKQEGKKDEKKSDDMPEERKSSEESKTGKSEPPKPSVAPITPSKPVILSFTFLPNFSILSCEFYKGRSNLYF